MKKIVLSVIMAALMLTAFGCKKPDSDKPGYIPPDLEYPGNETIDTEPDAPIVDPDLPFDTDPTVPGTDIVGPNDTEEEETKIPVTTPRVTEPPVTEPVQTTPKETEPPVTEPVASTPVETEPAATEDDFVVPDVIIVPTEIPYVITSLDGYFGFLDDPDPGYFSKGINIYYTVPGEEGVVHMNKLDNYGLMRYIGVHNSGEYDLDIELINFVLSGELQDVLVARRRNPEIIHIGGIAYRETYGTPRFIWVQTPQDDYIITFGDTKEEILVYTLKEYIEFLANPNGSTGK